MTLFDSEPEGAESEVAAPPAAKLELVIAYDGTNFHGFAPQSSVRTVQSCLLDALTKVLRSTPEELGFVGAGRTDAGVHARAQVVAVNAPVGVDTERVQRALNGMLGPEIVVRRCREVNASFHARRSALWRRYRYTILNQPEPDPFAARYSWWVPEPLDLTQLRLAADPFVGEHDFASFCRKGPEGSSTIRRVMESRWLGTTESDGMLVYEIQANAFCWQMVRTIVGTMVDAASGKLTPGDILRIVRAGNRDAARRIAPPHGLCLWEVGY